MATHLIFLKGISKIGSSSFVPTNEQTNERMEPIVRCFYCHSYDCSLTISFFYNSSACRVDFSTPLVVPGVSRSIFGALQHQNKDKRQMRLPEWIIIQVGTYNKYTSQESNSKHVTECTCRNPIALNSGTCKSKRFLFVFCLCFALYLCRWSHIIPSLLHIGQKLFR